MPTTSLPEVLPNEAWEPGLRDIIDEMNGRPLNVHRLLANNPTLLRAWWPFRNYTVKGGALTPRQTEIVILVVARAMNNAYEWNSHVDRALAAGLDAADIGRIRDGGGKWSPEEAVLVELVETLLAQHRIPESLLGRARDHFSDVSLMDVMFIHGAYLILGCLLNTYPIDLDEPVAGRLAAGGDAVRRLLFSADEFSPGQFSPED